MAVSCNICGCTDFQSFNQLLPRSNARCTGCKSLERHRALHYVLKNKGFLRSELKGKKKCLQLAPEKVTFRYISKTHGSGFVTTDPWPERYKHAKCLKLLLPQDFQIFPDNYFYPILHNHVLEHIPGTFAAHVDELYRVLEDGGAMAFTIPDKYILSNIKDSLEGGEEALPGDEKRIEKLGKFNHYKYLGMDLVDYLRQKFSVVELLADPREDSTQELIAKHNAKGIVFYCQKAESNG